MIELLVLSNNGNFFTLMNWFGKPFIAYDFAPIDLFGHAGARKLLQQGHAKGLVIDLWWSYRSLGDLLRAGRVDAWFCLDESVDASLCEYGFYIFTAVLLLSECCEIPLSWTCLQECLLADSRLQCFQFFLSWIEVFVFNWAPRPFLIFSSKIEGFECIFNIILQSYVPGAYIFRWRRSCERNRNPLTRWRTVQRFQNLLGTQSIHVLHIDAFLWIPEELLLVSLSHIPNWLPRHSVLITLVLLQSHLLRLTSCYLSGCLYLTHSKLYDSLLRSIFPILFREQAARYCVSEARIGFVFSAINFLLSAETICY